MRGLIARAAMLLLVSIPLAAPAIAAKPVAKAAARTPLNKPNWLTVGNRTAEGAIVIGNPAARVKMVEYLSLTCAHCALLSASAMPPLQRDYIAKGLVSLEVRHAVRDGFDFVASLLSRCQPAAQYLPSIEALFATQDTWMQGGFAAEQDPQFAARTADQKMALAATAAGLDSFFAKRGMSAKAYAACMADVAAKAQLARMASNSWERDAIPGTPSILLNGKRQDSVHQWTDLEPLIKAALK